MMHNEGKISVRGQKTDHAMCSLRSVFIIIRNSPTLEGTEAEVMEHPHFDTL